MTIGYLCKYTPVEMMESLGAEMIRIVPDAENFNTADNLLHPNTCSYVKGVLEDFASAKYDGLVLTTCCDSVRRLYDVLKETYPDRFIWLLDLPRKVNDFSVGLYEKRIEELARSWLSFLEKREENPAETKEDEACGRPDRSHRNEADSINVLAQMKSDLWDRLNRIREEEMLLKPPAEDGGPSVGILGARCPGGLRELLKRNHARILFDLTCEGMDRAALLAPHLPERKTFGNFGEQSGEIKDRVEQPGMKRPEGVSYVVNAEHPVVTDLVLQIYAGALLNQIPCMRMIKAAGRERYLEGFRDQTNGVIYHTVKFCDMYSYEYARLKQEGGLPILKVETDLTSQCEGQIRTRVEAFLESLNRDLNKAIRRNNQKIKNKTNIKDSKKEDTGEEKKDIVSEASMKKHFVVGLDSGSTSTNAVIMNDKKEILADVVIRTGAKSLESARRALEEVLKRAGKKREEIDSIVATGYGRVSIPFADQTVTEISCHAKGARYFCPDVSTILDIGGQDSKAIRLDNAGEVADFSMNDKCAAGTGRFLEAMARTLEVDISELGPISAKSEKKVTISSMCTVFAESEVISLIAQNTEKADIAAGVHRSIAGKACLLLKRVGTHPVLMMTGGVARNEGVVRSVEEQLGQKLFICEKPDIIGAVGAALYGLEI